MNGIAKLSAMIALTAVPLAGVAHAAMDLNTPQQVDQAVAHDKGNSFAVEQRDWVTQSAFDDDGGMVQQTPAETAQFQKALASNPTLVRDLKARNVEIGNVVGADQAADGSLTFYLR